MGGERTVARPLIGPAPSRVIASVTAVEGPRPAAADAMLATLREAAQRLLEDAQSS
jgi:hypothetical protein